MNDPWVFGWTQLLTILGFAITIAIAVGGFRTFARWKREKLEEKRIDVAIDALALTYESKFIFDNIRSPMSFPYESKDMPEWPGDTEDKRNQRSEFYAILKRIEAHKDFFERAWKMQVKCTAIFGLQAEEVFLLMQRARRSIEVSAGMLYRDPEYKTEGTRKTWEGFRADVWAGYGKALDRGDEVGKKLADFVAGMESLCRPIIDRQLEKGPSLTARVLERLR